ncbi:plasma-membrane proton-e [Myriangium duriaei CBS 260.36]|uniref:Plasma membrane ATPase n=1 Tax=Myriangium duriaei CBS 260.36 TaxID=1168546 RepID=A0A9P4MLS5_9PEZI|nr:plasma-membrane proton-e [Myriangium duriaei CBS 260.36]
MAAPRVSFGEKDLENGAPGNQSRAQSRKWSTAPGNIEDLDEYTALQKYISTYRDPKAAAEEEDAGKNAKDAGKGKAWWQFWRSGTSSNAASDDPGVVPEEWLESDIKQGISNSDVEGRRKRFGWNEIATEKENLFLKFLGFFTGPILYVMEIAALLAAGLRRWIDFGVILGILLLNAIVGWYQEKQAADVVASLKGDIAMKATVVRQGQEVGILAREIVPGDIIIIEEGQSVPADARVICDYDAPEDFARYRELREQHKLNPEEDPSGSEEKEDEGEEGIAHQGHSLIATDQSAITGESLAVDKYMGDVIYYTTGCKRGKAYAVALTSAKHSFVGRTATLVQGAKDQGHFKAIMNSIGTTLLVLVMFWILASWTGGFFRHQRLATPESDSASLLSQALILFIIGVPVGLPVVTTTTLAVGAAYLAKEQAIVQKLTAIESLAGVDILCSDKTGTLTANQLSIREPFVAEGQDVNWMMAVAALASSHNIKSLDPIDKVTILTLKRYPKARDILKDDWKTEKFTPFDPVSKRIVAVCTLRGDRYECTKGAPKAVLNLSGCSEEEAALFRGKATEFARRGFRSLGVAYKKNDGPWVLLGMLSMFDPPREDTAQTIVEAQQLGVPVKMLTGDAIAIAKETCKMLALGTKVYNSQKLIHGGLSGSTQHDLVERADGFAEVFPEHKYQVVEMLQQRGHLTAMTGDGVNDAPSLKKADCGIAVEGSSEAAQAAADIVFLAPGLSTIVLAIKISRQIFQRMKAYIQYRIALCLHLEIYLVTAYCGLGEYIEAELIVFIALFADLATVAVAYDNAHSEQRPVEWQLPKIWVISVILGILLAVGTWIVRGSMFLESGGLVQRFASVNEVLFLEIALTENWLIFVTRGGETLPSFQLVGAIFGVDVLATLFAAFGWLHYDIVNSHPASKFVQTKNGHVDVVTLVVIWAYSIGVTIIIAIVYYLLNNIQFLTNLGRKSRSVHDSKMENIIGHLSKLAIKHEQDAKTGESRWLLAQKAAEEEDEE